MRLPAPAAVPPIVFPPAAARSMPTPFGIGIVPVTSLPIRLPSTTLSPLASFIPSDELPETTFPGPVPGVEVTPPIVLPSDDDPSKMPNRLGTADVPAVSVPM